MARTKKYLSSRSSRTGGGFYRPLKRLRQKAKSTPENDHSYNESQTADVIQDEPLRSDYSSRNSQLKSARLESRYANHREPLREKKDSFSERPNREPEHKNNHIHDNHSIYENSSKPAHKPERHSTTKDQSSFTTHKLSGDRSKLNEKVSLLEKELENALKKENRFKEEVDELKQMLTEERSSLKKTVHKIHQDIRQTQPVANNKFFTISRELQDVVSEMNKLVEGDALTQNTASMPAPVTPSDQPMSTPNGKPAIQQHLQPVPNQQPNATPVQADQPSETSQPNPQSTQPESVPEPAQLNQDQNTEQMKKEEKPKKKGILAKIPKPVMIIGLAVLITGVIGGSAWYFLTRDTQIDEALLQEYLPEGTTLPTGAPATEEKKIEGQPSEQISEQSSAPAQPSENNKSSTLGASDDKYSESQSEVTFEQTQWDTFKVNPMGFEIDYPKNAVNVIKTDTSVTFIRKTGYIFKIQVIKTALDIYEYWKLIKASSLNYKVKETSFRDTPALFLELEDFTDYPGDKYLVKKGEYIYDIWYATYSSTLSDDDAKRIDIMLNSFQFLDE